MADNEMIITRAGYAEAMQWLDESLAGMKVPQEEIITAELLTEENFLQMEQLVDHPEEFSAKISIVNRLGDVSVILSARGEVYRPFSESLATAEGERYRMGIAILLRYRQQLKFTRRQGRNIVTMLIHEGSGKEARRMLAALVAGVLTGMLLKETVEPTSLHWLEENILNTVQEMCLHALIMATTPMIFFSVLSGFTHLSDTAYIGKLGGRLIVCSLTKFAFYVAAGLFAGYLLGGIPQILSLIKDEAAQPDTGTSLHHLIVNIIPEDLMTPFHTNNALQVLFLACFFGVMLARAGGWAAWARDGVEFLNRFFCEVTDVVIVFIPLLVVVSMAKLIIHTNLAALIPFGKLIMATALGLPASLLISTLLVAVFGKLSPSPFLGKVARFSPIPFSLSSSTAAMPATLSFCMTKLGINADFVRFSIPVGMQLNMDGTAFYVSIVSMMLAQTFGIPLDVQFCTAFFFVHFLTGLTGIGLIAMPSLLAGFGIPEVALAMVIGIEPILDMFGTAQSVIGNIASSLIVGRGDGKVNETIYNSPDV